MLRRFVPPLVLLGIAVLVLLARLWDIQMVQHEIWSTEAVNLVRSYGVEPYVRGALRDRKGRLITRDEEVYSLEFVWRDFRRGHPLGQVAMMRSLMLMRPVGLDEARPSLGDAALFYASLTPDAIEEFAKGGALDAGIDYVPALAATSEEKRREAAAAERRRPRAGDLRYYIMRMLRLSPRQVKDIGKRVENGAGGLSYLELAASVRDISIQEAQRSLRDDVIEADANLSRLASLIEWGEDDEGDDLQAVVAAGDRLVPLIEERRRAVDDDTADALFRIAAGFSSMRVNAETLRRFDLRWLRAALDWDERRLYEWEARRGGAFRDATQSWMAGRMIARAKIGSDVMWAGDRVVSAFAHAFRAGAEAWSRGNASAQDWRQVDELDVLSVLPSRLAVGDDLPEALFEAPVFPFQEKSLRTAGLEGPAVVAAAFEDTLHRMARSKKIGDLDHERTAKQLAGDITRVAERSNLEWNPLDEKLYSELLYDGYELLQSRLSDVLEAATEATPSRDRSHGLAFAAPFVEKALETRRYAIRDRGARARVVGGEPSTDLVLLVTRYSKDFAGFRVTSKTRRVPIAIGPDGETPLASRLVGAVRSPFLVEVMRRAPDREELAELMRQYALSEEDRKRFMSLLNESFSADEAIGGAGLEAWFDPELAGTSGYSEVLGLQDRMEGNRAAVYRAKEDGRDVELTLDIDLQFAAEDVLQHPEPPGPEERRSDDLWFESPVGALVLASVGGEIFAAASVPVKSGLDIGPPVTDGERAFARDRTLSRPKAQAPGSVVKPLLAAYALEHLGLDPKEGLEYCDADRPRPGTSPKDSKFAGYGVVNCNSTYGHSRGGKRSLNLVEALMASCNVYFAALGERFYGPESMGEAYAAFGFGQPTGVRYQDGEKRRYGITDSYRYSPDSPLHEDAPEGSPGPVARQYLGNGLVWVDTNVVQMVRAYAGLATGFLPSMTFVRRIGDETVPRSVNALDIGEEHLSLVRNALIGVVNEKEGTAFKKGLSEADLGFRFAAKTGSADYGFGLVPRRDGRGSPLDTYRKGTRKHTWVAGWFPAENPRYVLVVYLHDTSATASHSAVYVARQFLQRPEVKALMASHAAAGPEADGSSARASSGEGQ